MRRTKAAALILAMIATGLVACEQPTHEERVAELRGRYDAELNGFAVREVPAVVDVETVTPGEGEGAPAADEAAEEVMEEDAGVVDVAGEEGEAGEGEEMAEEVPMQKDVILDIVVRHDAPEMLPGLTLDVSHADAQEVEKEHYRIWVDTATLAKGESLQVNETLEDVDFQEGDRFFVEVRRDVPPAERSEYREYAQTESPE